MGRLKPAKNFSAVVMPDFFLDRLVTYGEDLNHFAKAIAQLKGKKETEVVTKFSMASPTFLK